MISSKPNGEPASSKGTPLLLFFGYLSWAGLLLTSLYAFFNGGAGDFGGFGIIILPLVMVFFGVGMRGTPLSPLTGLFWLSLGFVINFILFALFVFAVIDAIRRSKTLGGAVFLLTILIVFGGPTMNDYSAKFKYNYSRPEQCNAHSFLIRKYCLYVLKKEDQRKNDVEHCRLLGTDSLGRCISEVARYTNNIELCDIDLISYNKEREACIGQFNKELGILGVCERIRGKNHEHENNSWWQECYLNAARSLNDAKICEILPPNETGKGNDWLGFCLTDLARSKRDPKLCEQLRQLSPRSNEYYTCIKNLKVL